MKPTIDTFISSCRSEVRPILEDVRRTIHDAVPEATETIGYGIPTFQLAGKNMIHFGVGKHHIGLYATPDGHAEFEPELAMYKRGKGSVQFPLDEPMPLDLVRRIALFRAAQIKEGKK
jgi:uncharacterized protein YdhG (YjbR/CyaY superfamily)